MQITPQMRILVAVEPVDFRRGIDGMARLCREVLESDTFAGWLFVYCLAHARRHVVEVAPSFPAQCRHILETLGTLYRHDAEAREQALSPEARLAHHQTHSGPLLDDLHVWLNAQLADHLVQPNSSLGQAITYLLNHWTPLTLFLRQPGAPLDNNRADAASGITNGMPPARLCRAMRMGGWIERISAPTIVADAA